MKGYEIVRTGEGYVARFDFTESECEGIADALASGDRGGAEMRDAAAELWHLRRERASCPSPEPPTHPSTPRWWPSSVSPATRSRQQSRR